jgi:esterase/lipase superfamily enzyme
VGFLQPTIVIESGATVHRVLVATTRARDPRPGTLYSGERGPALDFAEIDVSVPPSHVAGRIEWPSVAPGNPSTDFVVSKATHLRGKDEFLSGLNAGLSKRPPGKRNVSLYIHGYNTAFSEALYRLVQINDDEAGQAIPVLFSWASRGETSQYVYDDNSATAARDDLERTIRLLFASKADRIDILAHSMGNWVAVEALRQIKVSGDLLPLSRIGSVVLAAPDIDIDVFKSQMRRIGKPRKPFFVVLSKNDSALSISSFLAGGKDRVGSDRDVEELNELGAIVIDLTNVSGKNASDHDKFAQLASIAPQIVSVLEQGVGTNQSSASPDQRAQNSGFATIIGFPAALLAAPVPLFLGH